MPYSAPHCLHAEPGGAISGGMLWSNLRETGDNLYTLRVLGSDLGLHARRMLSCDVRRLLHLLNSSYAQLRRSLTKLRWTRLASVSGVRRQGVG